MKAGDSRSFLWAIAGGVVLFFGATHPERFGLDSETGNYSGWWLFSATLYLPGLAALTTVRSVRRSASKLPVAFFMASMLWTLAVSPLGGLGASDVVSATGALSLASVGIWLVTSFGWSTTRTILARSLLILLASSAVVEVVAGTGDRWQGLANHPNRLAPFAAIAIPIALSVLKSDRLAPALLGLSMLTLWMTDSRTSMLAAALGALVVVGGIIDRSVFPLAAAVLAAGAVVIVTTDSEELLFEAAARSGESEEISTLNGRSDVWPIAITSIESHPWTGVGAATTPVMYDAAFVSGEVSWPAGHPHNALLQTAMSGGLPAAVLFAASLLSYGLMTRRSALRRPERDAIVAAMVVIGLNEDLLSFPGSLTLLLAACMVSVSLDSSRRALQLTEPAARSGTVRPVHASSI